MTGDVLVPRSLWRDISDFFAALFAPCKDCVRGNTHTCWNGGCPTFRFRNIARRVAAVRRGELNFARWMVVENEILGVLRAAGRPLSPASIVLDTTRSRANKHNAINRLLRQGRIVQTRSADGRHRLISIQERKKRDHETTNHSPDRGGTTRRPPARELGAGSPDPRHDSRAE